MITQKKDYQPRRLAEYFGAKLLLGQKALVTGADSGIGRAVAIAFGQSGADVVVNYFRQEAQAEEVANLIRGSGRRSFSIKADVSKEEEVLEMFHRTIDQFGSIDLVVSNSGIQRDAPFDTMSWEEWDQVISVNLTGHFLCAREAIREFKRSGLVSETSISAGKIIFMSSVHELIPWAGHANYAAAKGGTMMLMKTLAQEVARSRIRVNSICPGAIRTPINRQAWETPEAHDALMKLIPAKRIGEPEDIAQVAVFLASDLADYINGASIFVDGGMTLYPEFASGG